MHARGSQHALFVLHAGQAQASMLSRRWTGLTAFTKHASSVIGQGRKIG
jgi:hypothetical protein